jgi:hypothetical protein
VGICVGGEIEMAAIKSEGMMILLI